MSANIELSTDDVVEAFCKMLEPGVKKGVLPAEDCNKYGIDVLYHKRDQALIMFHFVTMDMLEVNLELDLIRLQQEGKAYLDFLYGLLCDQTQEARKVRQEDNTITLYNTGSHVEKQHKAEQEKGPPKPNKLAETVSNTIDPPPGGENAESKPDLRVLH